MEKTNKSKLKVVILACIVVLFFLYKNIEYYYYMNYTENGWQIAKTIEYTNKSRYIRYKFYVDTVLYYGVARRDYKNYKLHKFFYVKYSKVDPSFNKILFEYEEKDIDLIKSSGFDVK